MKHITCLILLFTHFTGLTQFWGTNTTSQLTNEYLDIETDASGNLYVAGYISGETSFDVGIVQTSVVGTADAVLAKYNAQGELIWYKTFGGVGSDKAFDIAIGPDQNPVVAGQFFATMTIDGVSVSSAGSRDIFLAKFNPSGNLVWATSTGGTGEENVYSVATDASGAVVIAGQFKGNSILAGTSFTSTVNPTTNTAEFDLFVAKYNGTGTPLWVRTGSAPYEDLATAVTTDAANNIYLTGQFSKNLTFSGTTISNQAYNIGFATKLSPSGTLQYFNKITGGSVAPQDIRLGISNEVYIAGNFGGMLNYTDGSNHLISPQFSRNIFLIKTDQNGSYVSADVVGSENAIGCKSIAVNHTNQVYLTGYFTCFLSQLRASTDTNWNSAGFRDPFIMEFSSDAQFIRAQQYGGQKDDIGQGITISQGEKPIMCGTYTASLCFPTSLAAVQTAFDNFSLYPSTISPFLKLHGDNSPNAFITNLYDPAIPDYDYFVHAGDSLQAKFAYPQSYPCTSDSLIYNAQTYLDAGPLYTYLWNTGDSIRSILPLVPGPYNVHVERRDGCVSNDMDTVVFQTPAVLISDDLVELTLDTLDQYIYNLCPQDSLHVWFQGVYADSILITHPNGVYTDYGPHSYAYADDHTVTVSNQYCKHSPGFKVNIIPTPAPEEMDPRLLINGLINDTVHQCSNDAVTFWLLDSITNPALQTNVYYPQPIAAIVDGPACVPNSLDPVDRFVATFQVQSSGWYTLEFDISTGTLNECLVDTQTFHEVKHFYVIVDPAPNFNTVISADGLFCPNGSVYLFTSNTHSSLHWSGPGVSWTSQNGDTAQVTASGQYHYTGTITDPTNGCHEHFNFPYFLYPKTPPVIDGATELLCPNDSLVLSVPDIYLSYEWILPSADVINGTNEITGHEIGSYYCHVVDSEGCLLTALPYIVNEYSSPYLSVLPQEILCSGESATIVANTSALDSVSWFNPPGFSGLSLTTDTAGTYICTMSGCGISVTDTIEIIDGTFSVSLLTADTLICGADSILLSVADTTFSYTWSNGFAAPSQVVHEAGDYDAIAVNEFGCTAQTETVHIGIIAGSENPRVGDTTICAGGPLILTDTATSTQISWYTSDSLLIQQGSVITLNSLVSDTNLLVAHSVGGCPAAYSLISISIIDSLPEIDIPSEVTLCPSGSTTVSAQPDSLDYEWNVYGNFISGSILELDASEADTSQSIVLTVSNGCFSEQYEIQVDFSIPDTINFGPDSLQFCLSESAVLTPLNPVQTLNWTSAFGNYTGPEYALPAISGEQWVYLSGYDSDDCPAIPDSVFVQSIAMNYVLNTSQTSWCPGGSLGFDLISPADSLVWSHNGLNMHFTDTVVELSESTTGMWYLTQFDTNGCVFYDTVQFFLASVPQFEITTDSLICMTDLPNLPTSGIGNDWIWNISEPFTSNVFFGAQEVVITTINDSNCTFTDTLLVIDCGDAPPNIFTPNGDGVNDYFVVDDALLHPNNQLIIINRWGNVVFKQNGYRNTFNGEGATDGVYFYTYIQDTTQVESRKFTGSISIFR